MREKIIDCIIFDGSVGMLNFRISEVFDIVDFIYVIYHGNDKKNNLESDNFLFKNNHKIKLLEYSSNIIDGFTETRELILKENLNFDDIISISNVNELPNYNDYSEIKKILPFSPVILLQKKYTWSLDYMDNNFHLGTKVCFFTNFFKYTSLYNTAPESKMPEPIYETHHNGWSFFGFEVGESDLKSNLLPYNNIDKFKTNLLIKCFDNDNFEKIYDYVGVPTIKIRDKKIVYIGDVEPVIYCDEKLLFKESNELSVESEFNEIFIPKIPLYESNNFRIEFFLNEVKKYMTILFLLPQDDVIFNFKFMNGNKIVKWSDVSEKNILELILN